MAPEAVACLANKFLGLSLCWNKLQHLYWKSTVGQWIVHQQRSWSIPETERKHTSPLSLHAAKNFGIEVKIGPQKSVFEHAQSQNAPRKEETKLKGVICKCNFNIHKNPTFFYTVNCPYRSKQWLISNNQNLRTVCAVHSSGPLYPQIFLPFPFLSPPRTTLLVGKLYLATTAQTHLNEAVSCRVFTWWAEQNQLKVKTPSSGIFLSAKISNSLLCW